MAIIAVIETALGVTATNSRTGRRNAEEENVMGVYKVIRLVGTSPTSWEEAATNAVEEAAKHLHDLRVSEVEQLDMRLEDGKVVEYRARVHVSFRYKGSDVAAVFGAILQLRGAACSVSAVASLRWTAEQRDRLLAQMSRRRFERVRPGGMPRM